MAGDTSKDIVAGAAGGVAQVLIGQPFGSVTAPADKPDLVKVRLQSQGGQATQVFRDALKHEGVRAFYKGTLPPLLGVGACVSIQFGAFQYFQHLIQERNTVRYNASLSELSLGQYYVAGGAAGITNSVISGPIEHLRIRMQTQPRGDARLYSGPLDAARKIIQSAGISGLYRGQVVTLMREFHGYGVWFAAYEGFVSAFAKYGQCARDDLPKWKSALCGGLAGEALWLLSHPLDVLKSKMQSDGFGGTQEYRNLRDVVRKTWMRHGIGGFFEGLGPALLRAAPVSAGTFATVEVVRQALG